MTTRIRDVGSAALALLEYAAISILFDARQLVPPSLWDLGELAPIPVIAGAAFLILRTSAAEGGGAPLPPVRETPPLARRVGGLAALQVVAFACLLALSAHVRGAHDAGEPAVGLELTWLALAALTAGLLVAVVLAGRAAALVTRLGGPLAVGLVVGVAAWAAGQGTGELWRPLSRATMLLVSAVLHAIAPDPVVDHDALVIGTERFSVEIAPVCSGYEGMGLVAVLLGSFVWSYRATLRFPHALAVPVLGVALAFLANALRITALIFVGSLGASDAAYDAFHSKAGWILFCAVALGAVALARRWTYLQRGSAARDDGAGAGGNPTVPYLVPLAALVATRLVAGLADDGNVGFLEAAPAAAALIALALLRRGVREALASSATLVTRPTVLAGAVGVGVALLWLALTAGDRAADESVAAHLAAWPAATAALWIALRLAASVVLAPVVEELAFRGFLQRRVVRSTFSDVDYRASTPAAVLLSAAVFGALHTHVVAGFVAGVAFGATAWATGRLRDAVFAHAVSNAIIAVVVMAGGRWSLWV